MELDLIDLLLLQKILQNIECPNVNYYHTIYREQIQASSVFCPIQAFTRLDDAHPHWGRPPVLLNPPI